MVFPSTDKGLGYINPSFEPAGNEEVDKQENERKICENKTVEKERVQWGNSIEFVMSCVATSVGLGNIWRFPFTAYKNGGGAFLIPYLFVLIFIGRPLYYMEMALGQFSQKGNIRLFQKLSPYMRGVGYGQFIAVIFVSTYYCSLIAIALLYLYYSFTSNLPWGECLSSWEDYLQKENKTCISAFSKGANISTNNTISSSELFFTREVFNEKADINDGIGLPDWRLTLCLFISWVITFLISVRGVKSSGKASYFLALFPYVIMIALLIRAATLDGAAEGMYYFIKPDLNKLLEAEVWYEAATQCFFSLNVGFGCIMMFSSYNDFSHNIYRDALIVTTLDTFTSLLAGITIFGILGNLAHNLGVKPEEVIKSGGASLAFISYPDAIAKMEAVPWLFSIMFFFMLFVLGNGSLVALHGTLNTVIQDHFPNLPTWLVAGVTATGAFLIGLMYVTPGGQFMLNLVDHFGVTLVIFTFIVLQVTGVAWFYGVENFSLDIEYMLKRNVGLYWKLTWAIITPILLIAIFIYFCVTFKSPTYNGQEYPVGVLVFGWAIFILALVQFVFWIGYYVYKNRNYGYPGMVKKTFSNENWGPADQRHHEEWKKFKDEASTNFKNEKNIFKKFLKTFACKFDSSSGKS